MSRFPLYDLARDASVAVGAYVGVLREHVKTEWATVLGGSFDERVAQAKARMEAAADMRADKEAEEEVSDSWCNGCDQYTSVCGGPHPCSCTHCSSAPGVVAASGSDSSPEVEAAVGEPPEVEPQTPQAAAPSGGLAWTFDPARLSAADVRRIVREEVDRAFDQFVTICEQVAETVSPVSLFDIRKK